uniref:Uncharacterized protein n=1 Tax=Mesocestoides corti TaxID=53468 RepID=A0A5K3FVC1_MESCO
MQSDHRWSPSITRQKEMRGRQKYQLHAPYRLLRSQKTQQYTAMAKMEHRWRVG